MLSVRVAHKARIRFLADRWFDLDHGRVAPVRMDDLASISMGGWHHG